jgi:hypothetical protein
LDSGQFEIRRPEGTWRVNAYLVVCRLIVTADATGVVVRTPVRSSALNRLYMSGDFELNRL